MVLAKIDLNICAWSRNLEVDLAGAGLQGPFITACPRILPSLATLVTASFAKLIGFSVEKSIQRLFDSPQTSILKRAPRAKRSEPPRPLRMAGLYQKGTLPAVYEQWHQRI
jgi:hypothetical protein